MQTMPMRAALALAVLAIARVGWAEPAGPPTSRTATRAEALPGGGVARLAVTWSAVEAECGATVTVDAQPAIPVHRGAVAGTLVAGHGRLFVAYFVDGDARPFRIRSLRREGARSLLGEPVRVSRPSGRGGTPFAVAATPLPDGFAVFFQELSADDPSAARTFLVRLDQSGQPRGPAEEVPVPWSLGAAAWNGHGYHLALFYPGNGTGMRLSMVSLSVTGQPEQHPDWASAAGYIADVHLEPHRGRIRAFYRGGPGGDRLLESDVTTIGPWGNEPRAARDHGPLPFDRALVIDRRSEGPTPTHTAAP